MQIKSLLVWVLLLLSTSSVFAQQIGASLTYDITSTTNVEVGVNTYIYIRSPTTVSEEGSALFEKKPFMGQGYFMTEYLLKSTGVLIVKDQSGHALSLKVTSPEEEKKAQVYASRLEACLLENAKLLPTMQFLEKENKMLASNLSYYKRYVDANLTLPPEIKYVTGGQELLAGVSLLEEKRSFAQLLRNNAAYSFYLFVLGAIAAYCGFYIIKKIKYLPAGM